MPTIQLKANPEKVLNKNVTILLIKRQLDLKISERSARINRLGLICYCNIFLSLGGFYSLFISDSAVMSQNLRNETGERLVTINISVIVPIFSVPSANGSAAALN